jgi:hypothetical protein
MVKTYLARDQERTEWIMDISLSNFISTAISNYFCLIAVDSRQGRRFASFPSTVDRLRFAIDCESLTSVPDAPALRSNTVSSKCILPGPDASNPKTNSKQQSSPTTEIASVSIGYASRVSRTTLIRECNLLMNNRM